MISGSKMNCWVRNVRNKLGICKPVCSSWKQGMKCWKNRCWDEHLATVTRKWSTVPSVANATIWKAVSMPGLV